MIDFGFNQAELCWGDASTGNGMNAVNVHKVVDGVKAIGGSRVRMAVQLGTWDDLDRAVNACTDAGLKPLLCIMNNPQFGYDGTTAGYGAQCKAIALRYGPSGTNQCTEYELFNEENSSLNAPGVGSPSAFVPFLKAGHDAIKAVHASALVICGGTIPAPDTWIPFIGNATNPVEWYTGIYAAGGQNYFDALGFHLYTDGPPTPGMPQWKYLTDLRDFMVSQGDASKQIWITEVGVGYPGAPGNPNLTQARDWAKIMMDAIVGYPWCGVWFIYNYRDCTTNASDANSIYGVVDNAFQPKEPYYSFAATIRGMDGSAGVPTRPAAPTSLVAVDVTDTSATITANPSIDDVAATTYRLYLNGSQYAQSGSSSVPAPHLTPGTPYVAYMTAVDAAGLESVASGSIHFTTNAPAGQQAYFAYDFGPTGSSTPTQFSQQGLGFHVVGGVALPNTSSIEGEFWTLAPWVTDHRSPDHSSEIVQAAVSDPVHSNIAAAAVARMKPDGSQWMAAFITGGGTADACRIVTFDAGVWTLREATNAAPLLPTERLALRVEDNIATVRRIGADNTVTVPLDWTDRNGLYAGRRNLRSGIGWWQRRVGSVNYVPPGISRWNGADLSAVQSPGAGAGDVWPLALIKPIKWPTVIATGIWENALR